MRLRQLMLMSLRGDYVRSTPATHDEVMSALNHPQGFYFQIDIRGPVRAALEEYSKR